MLASHTLFRKSQRAADAAWPTSSLQSKLLDGNAVFTLNSEKPLKHASKGLILQRYENCRAFLIDAKKLQPAVSNRRSQHTRPKPALGLCAWLGFNPLQPSLPLRCLALHAIAPCTKW